ncbi:transposase, partial [Chryseobacterium koreense CCUG 49689]
MLSSYEILRLLLPEFLIEHFDITAISNIDDVLHISFEEK